MITLRDLTEENIEDLLKLKAGSSKEGFVANSFAIAWLLRECAKPLLIYTDEMLVGFILIVVNESESECYISRLMIDATQRRRGYAKGALFAAAEYARNLGCKSAVLSFSPQNEFERKLYGSVGFVESGKTENGELVMEKRLVIE